MQIENHLDGSEVASVAELIERIRAVRKDRKDTFACCHDDEGPLLWVHLSHEFAYLHYANQSGPQRWFDSDGMAPSSCPASVQFFLPHDYGHPSGFDVPRKNVCTIEDACQAVEEFSRTPAMPSCIKWVETELS
jgi:hypothetical protein